MAFNKNKFKNITFSSTIFVIFTKTRLKRDSSSRLSIAHSSQFYDSHNVKFYLHPGLFSYPLNHWDPDILKIAADTNDLILRLKKRRPERRRDAWIRRCAFVRRPFRIPGVPTKFSREFPP